MKRAIGHVAVVVEDYDEAIRFYVETLGFILVEDTPVEAQGKRWVLVAPPGSTETEVLLARAEGPEQASRVGNQTGGRVFLFLHTDDFWRDFAAYRSKGVAFVRGPSRESYGIVAVFRDLYGNLWDLLQLDERRVVSAGRALPKPTTDAPNDPASTGTGPADRGASILLPSGDATTASWLGSRSMDGGGSTGVAAERLKTAEELWCLPDDGICRELIDGEVRESMPPGEVHAAIAVALATLLRLWVKQCGSGYVGVEAGYVLARDPDCIRGPDVSFIRGERIPPGGIPEGFWELAPDLAVEVVAPTEAADEVRGKVRDFLAAGTRLVWVVYPRTREVIAHLPDGRAWALGSGDPLESPDVLPGFFCTIADLFE